MLDVTDLPPYTTFGIWVSAITAAGAGPEQATPLVLTTPQAACQQMSEPYIALLNQTDNLYAVSWAPPVHPDGFIVRSVIV